MIKLYLICAWVVYTIIGLYILNRVLNNKNKQSDNVIGSLAFICIWPVYVISKIIKKIKNEFKKFYTFLVKKN